MDGPLGGGDDRIKPDQGAGGNDDGATAVLRQLHQMVVGEQGADREHDQLFFRPQQGLGDLRQQLGRGALHHDVGVITQLTQADDGNGMRKFADKLRRLRGIFRRHRGQHKTGYAALAQFKRNDLADGAQAGDGNPHFAARCRVFNCSHV